MKKRIYLVRHGESEVNVGGVSRGSETPLTKRGLEQAQFIAQRASKLPIEVIVSSTMVRARQTASVIAEAINKKVETSEYFVERRNPSAWYGVSASDPESIRTERLINEHFGDEDFRFSDEENWQDIKERALKALKYLEQRQEEHILVVSHAVFLRVLLGVVMFGEKMSGYEASRAFRSFKNENTGLSIFQYEPENILSAWRIVVWNDHAHLAD